jgi:capsular polysaccharide transport system permease protein
MDITATPEKMLKARIRKGWHLERDVILALFIRETKTRFGHLRLGLVWAVLEPVAHIVLFSLVWGLRGHLSIQGVHAYYFILSGILPWTLFNNIVNKLMNAVDANRGLFFLHQVRPLHTFCARTLLEFTIFTVVFVLLLAAGIFLGIPLQTSNLLTAITAYAALTAFSFALGGNLAVLVHHFPETQKFVAIFLKVLYFVSGVFFSCKSLPYAQQVYFAWNPVFALIDWGRDGFFGAPLSEFFVMQRVVLLTGVLLLLFAALYKKFWRSMMAT